MNTYIKSQIINMQQLLRTFDQAVKLAAIQDDGVMSKAEAKQLRQLQAASEKFRKELENINSK